MTFKEIEQALKCGRKRAKSMNRCLGKCEEIENGEKQIKVKQIKYLA